MSKRLRWTSVALLLTLATLFFLTPARNEIAADAVQLLELVRGTGPWGPLILGVAYVVATVLLVPGFVLTLAAGFLFGPIIGAITVSLGSLVGASAAFLLGRTLARRVVELRVASNERFRHLDDAIGKSGFAIVLLTRLSPLFPFNVLNYALALSKVSFATYVLASWIGMLPATVLYVYVGSTLQSLTEVAAGKADYGAGRYVVIGVGLLATIAVTVVITRAAASALKKRVAELSANRDQKTKVA